MKVVFDRDYIKYNFGWEDTLNVSYFLIGLGYLPLLQLIQSAVFKQFNVILDLKLLTMPSFFLFIIQ